MTHLCSSHRNNKNEPVERFYGQLKEQAENSSLGDEYTTLICDTFILKMLNFDTMKERLKETVTLAKAIEMAINMETHKINKT